MLDLLTLSRIPSDLLTDIEREYLMANTHGLLGVAEVDTCEYYERSPKDSQYFILFEILGQSHCELLVPSGIQLPMYSITPLISESTCRLKLDLWTGESWTSEDLCVGGVLRDSMSREVLVPNIKGGFKFRVISLSSKTAHTKHSKSISTNLELVHCTNLLKEAPNG